MTRTAARANIETVMTWLDAMRRRDLDSAVACFAPDVVWQGLVPDVHCANRDDVREMLSESINEYPDVKQLELIGAEHHAVLCVASPALQELAGVKLHGQLFNAFTIDNNRIVHVRDFALRREAQAAANIHELVDWR